jgi:small-conductance mechanosensitive channel
MDVVLFLMRDWRDAAWSAGIIVVAIAMALIVRWIAFIVLKRLTRRRGALLGESLVRHAQKPSQWILPLLAILTVGPGLPLPQSARDTLEHATGLGLIAAMAWLAILLIAVTSDILSGRYRIDVADNLLARRIQTQFQMIHRIAIILVVVVAVAIMLMTFPAIKHIGVSILASAGVVSLVVGMSMKDTLSNLIAGVQIAFAQPFRIGDAVVVENEWGWIEEIGMMYVVVRIWDLRRLVLPLSYFLTNAFQNWTRTSADLCLHLHLHRLHSSHGRSARGTAAHLRRLPTLEQEGLHPAGLRQRPAHDATACAHGRAQFQRCLGSALPGPGKTDRFSAKGLSGQPSPLSRRTGWKEICHAGDAARARPRKPPRR